jgi:serine/threonine protein kinase
MPSSLTCLEEADLLSLAMGEPVPADVAAHLEGCAFCRSQLERAKGDVAFFRALKQEAPLLDEGEAGSTPDEEPLPAAIGKYLVVGRFDDSGQAEVYRVVHPQFQQERVLKLAKAPVGPDGRSEIVEEGKIMVELEHPHLIRVYDLDFLDDRPYLVMEYIRGRNLEQYAGEKPLSCRQAATMVAKVAGAAGFAHRRGIVHRDIKPRNILVDERGEPRLIDFGMARLRTVWSDDRKEPDGGTFAFMAPEQARIDSPEERRKVGPRSDVFALGATLYFLLTGQAPFAGQSWREAWDRARRCDFDPGALNDRSIPLPANIDLAASIGPLPSSPLWNELEVAMRGGDEGQPVEPLRVALHRGIDEEESLKIDDPLLHLMERL